MRTRLLPLLAVALLLALAACNRRGDWRLIQLYGGEGSVAALRAPDRVEVFQLEPRPSDPEVGVARVGDFPVVAGPVTLDDDEVTRLQAVLLDPETYDFWRTKPDEFRPTLGLRIRKGPSFVDVAVCRESNMILIFREGRRVGAEDYDAARTRLLTLLDDALGETPK